MKKITLILVLAIGVGLSTKAQDETNYLFGNDMTISGFGGLMVEGSTVKNKGVGSVGGGGGMLIDQSLFLGGYGMGNVSDGALFTYNNSPVSFDIGHGGLWLGYVFMPKKVAHFGLSSRIGWGGIGLTDSTGTDVLNDDIFVISPQAEFELNVLPFLKLNFFAGYRSVFGVNNAFFSNNDFASPYGGLGIYFGWFGNDY